MLPLGVDEPAGIAQWFVSTHNGTGIQYEEFVRDVSFEFTLKTDQVVSEKTWAMIWLTAQEEGIGAARSQGNGRFRTDRLGAARAMTQTRLFGFEAAALRGADLLDDDELAGKLAELVDIVATGDDDHERVQDLRELAAVALVAARRLGR